MDPKGFFRMPRLMGRSFKEAAEALALSVELLAARADQRWISVDVRLPPCPRGRDNLGTQVLVWPYVDGSATAYYGRRVTGKPTFYLYGAVARVTHWMPLPEGPK